MADIPKTYQRIRKYRLVHSELRDLVLDLEAGAAVSVEGEDCTVEGVYIDESDQGIHVQAGFPDGSLRMISADKVREPIDG